MRFIRLETEIVSTPLLRRLWALKRKAWKWWSSITSRAICSTWVFEFQSYSGTINIKLIVSSGSEQFSPEISAPGFRNSQQLQTLIMQLQTVNSTNIKQSWAIKKTRIFRIFCVYFGIDYMETFSCSPWFRFTVVRIYKYFQIPVMHICWCWIFLEWRRYQITDGKSSFDFL